MSELTYNQPRKIAKKNKKIVLTIFDIKINLEKRQKENRKKRSMSQ